MTRMSSNSCSALGARGSGKPRKIVANFFIGPPCDSGVLFRIHIAGWRNMKLKCTCDSLALIAGAYLGRHQHTSGAPRACGPVWRRGRQGHGRPGLAQGEATGRRGRQACLPRTDRAAHSRRHSGARSARPQSEFHLAPCGPWHTRGRPEGAARNQEHGRREHRGLAHRCSTISSSAACDGPSSSSSTARRNSTRPSRPSGTACRSNAARSTSTGTF
jgi:hypothetical protein